MTRRYGRSIKGMRVNDYVPDTRRKAMSIISSIRMNGQTESLVYKNSLTGDFFKQYLKECLCLSLKPGDIVISVCSLNQKAL